MRLIKNIESAAEFLSQYGTTYQDESNIEKRIDV